MTMPATEPSAIAIRAAAWREKHPDRARALRRLVASLLGHPPRAVQLTEATLAAMCEPTEERILAAVYGVEA